MKTPQEKKYCNTEIFSQKYQVKPDSVRRSLCLNGHYQGIRPLKLLNGRLLWPDVSIEEMLAGKVTL